MSEWVSEVTQSCPTLCDPVDCSPPDSSVHGILQARILEWVAVPSPGDLPDPGIEPRSPTLQADALTSEPCNSVLRQESWTNPRARFSFQSHHTLERRTVGTEVSKAKCFLKTVFREIQKRKKKLETIPNWMWNKVLAFVGQ